MGEIIICTAALYGFSTIVSEYDGPFSLLAKIRSKAALARCCVCVAVWAGIPIAYFAGLGVVGYLAIVGGVIALDRIIG